MGSSNRKKKEKQKDFQKPKLKVGKAKAKASNFTDTSFKSKAIVLNQQLSEDAPDPADRFRHYLSLSTSRSDTQRRDALAYLTGQLSLNPPLNPIGTPALLNKLLPLVSDASGPVRNQLLKLFKAIPKSEIRPHSEKIVMHIRGGMTHISTDIQADGLNLMEWLLDVAGDELVACAGGWVKPLKCFMSIVRWGVAPPASGSILGSKGWSSAPRTTFGARNGHLYPRQLQVLAKFLEVGFRAEQFTPWSPESWRGQISQRADDPDPFGYLGLFKPHRDEDSEMYRNREDRQEVFRRRFHEAMVNGADTAKKEGGAAGRAAAVLDQVLKDGMGDYESTPVDDEHIWDGYMLY